MVSVILCTYNRAGLLPAAIRSVLAQSEQDWELIVIDDGSTDGTRVVVDRFRRNEPRIRYRYQRNRGLAAARNAGLAMARGAFLTFLDSDDAYAPDHLRKRLRYMRRHPSTDMIHGGVRLFGPRTKRYVVDMEDPTRTIHLRHCHIGGTFFFRRSVLRRVKGFARIPFSEDFDFYHRAARHFTIDRVPFRTYHYHLDSPDRLCDIFTEKLKRLSFRT